MTVDLKILIIDDDIVDRKAVKRLLLSSQIELFFLEAQDWDAAKSILENYQVNIILLDYKLPKYDGLTILKKLKELYSDIPVIVLTGRGDEETAVSIIKAGATDYLSKEKLTTQVILHSLQNALHLANLQKEAKRSEQLLKIVLAGTSVLSGKAFFDELTHLLATFFSSEYSFLIEISGQDKFKILSSKFSDKLKPSDAEFKSIIHEFLSHKSEFIELTDLKLKRFKFFFGTMIRSAQSGNIGMIGFLKNRPFLVSEEELQVLHVFANRSAVEIERIRTESALRNSEEELRAIYDHSIDAVVTFVDGMIKFTNKAFMSLFGINEDTPINTKSVFRFIEKKDRRKIYREINLISRGEKEQTNLEAIGINLKKESFFLDINISSYISNQKLTVLLLLRDITIKKQMEREIIKSNKLESISILAGGIAHDFNNILTAILGNLTLAKLSINKDDKSYKKIADAEHATSLAKDLTQQLLTFSKGGNPIKTTTSLTELVKESTDFVLRGSSVIPEYIHHEEIYNADIDIGQINQVINNLVINAKQAMNDRGKLFIRFENFLKNTETPLPISNGDYICISIQDEGQGIAAENIVKIFDPFFTTKKHGSGLGLANCYSIIKKHGGTIAVQSEPKKGSTFTVYLPASKEKVTEEYKNEDKIEKINGRVLIIDDNQSIRKVLSEILETIGLSTEISSSFDESVQHIKQLEQQGQYYDYVILDLTIPGSHNNALDTCKEIKSISPASKLIISSGYSNDKIIVNHTNHGFSGALIKPYRFEDVNKLFYELSK